MANVTLDEEFNSLGNPWQPTYPWSPNGWAAGDMGSFLANPALLPPDANPISVDNGNLVLTDMPKPSDVSSDQIGGLSRIAGQVLTENQFSQTYGYFEARIQMPAGAGEGTDFWLLSQGGSWPPELDIAEMIGSYPDILVNTLHGDGAPDGHWMGVADMTQGFHTYAVDWEPDKDYVVFRRDGDVRNADHARHASTDVRGAQHWQRSAGIVAGCARSVARFANEDRLRPPL